MYYCINVYVYGRWNKDWVELIAVYSQISNSNRLRAQKLQGKSSMANGNVTRDVSHCPKYNRRNFSTYKFGAFLLFETQGLKGVVDGSSTCPEPVIAILHLIFLLMSSMYCNKSLIRSCASKTHNFLSKMHKHGVGKFYSRKCYTHLACDQKKKTPATLFPKSIVTIYMTHK